MENHHNHKARRSNWNQRIGIQKAVLTLPSWQKEWKTAAPKDFELSNGSHIWRIHIQQFLAAWNEDLQIILTKAELEKAAAIKFPGLRAQYLAARGAQRCLLGEYLKADPHSLTFSKNRWGKPSLCTAQNIHFNLSHSGPWILLAVSAQRPIGVDIERVTPAFDYRTMVDQYFHPAEKKILSNKYTYQSKQFFSLWTRKEALAKAIGLGLHERLLATNMLEESLPATPPGHNGGFFAIHSFEVDHENIGALALRNDLNAPKFLHFP